jgi:hypothetical protein
MFKRLLLALVLFSFVALSGAQVQFPPTYTVTQTTPTVTNASQAFNAQSLNRRLLIIQNNDSVGVVYVRFDGTATTASLKIAPGGNLFFNVNTPAGVLNMIGSIASNANVVVVEGN